MSTNSLPHLPVEILHIIFDRLDISTVLRSARYVCKHFYAVVDSYSRYKIDITSMSASDIKLLSRQIQPERISSLIVCDHYLNKTEYKMFCSIFDITQFTGLHSLTLLDIQDNDLQQFLELVRFKQVRCDFYSFLLDTRLFFAFSFLLN